MLEIVDKDYFYSMFCCDVIRNDQFKGL